MCARCHIELMSDLFRSDDELCTYCATLTRIEAERGIARLQRYLANWAAFEHWVTLHAREPVPTG